MWQDWVLSIVQWVFALVLIPTILHREHKPPFSTSALNALLMLLVVCTYVSMKFTSSAIAGLVLGLCWLIIAAQRYRLNKGYGPLITVPKWLATVGDDLGLF